MGCYSGNITESNIIKSFLPRTTQNVDATKKKLLALCMAFIKSAVLNYNTLYRSSLGCEQSRVVRGRIAHNVVDFKTGFRPQNTPMPPRRLPKMFLTEHLIY